MLKRRGAKTKPCGTLFLRRRKLLGLLLVVLQEAIALTFR